MKTENAVTGTVCLLLSVLAVTQGCNQPKTDNRRFEIVAATFDEVNLIMPPGDITGSSTPRRIIFKLDTQTGKTWMYQGGSFISTGGVTSLEGWYETKSGPPRK